MLKKMRNRNGQPRPPAVDGIKIFDNDGQAALLLSATITLQLTGTTLLLQPGHHYQKFYVIPLTAEGLGRPF